MDRQTSRDWATAGDGGEAAALVTSPIAARYVGESVPRREDKSLVTGRGRYVDDWSPPGTVHAFFVRSDVAAGAIKAVDVSGARAHPGVLAVFTAAELNPLAGIGWHSMLGGAAGPKSPPPLAEEWVAHVGEPIAMIVADSRYVAEDAAELVSVDIERESCVADYRSAASGEVLAFPHTEANVKRVIGPSDLNGALDAIEKAEHVVRAKVEQNRYVAAPMETRGILAFYDQKVDELDIVLSGQSAHSAREFFARYLRIPEAKVRVRTLDVGGGFGQKMFVGREECAAVLASRYTGRPVKWIEDRRENLIASPHSRNEIGEITMGVDAAGNFVGIAIDHISDLGAHPAVPSGGDVNLLPGPYKTARLAYRSRLVSSNTTGRGAYRGPWMYETTAREMAIDVTARAIGMDPADLRRRNILYGKDLPFTSPGGYTFKDATPGETLEKALEVVDYDGFRQSQTEARQEGRLAGIGLSVYIEHSAKASGDLGTEGASIRIESSGLVTAYLGTSSHGQSVETTMAQVIADVLGVRIEDVTIVQGDSSSTPFGPGTGGSRTAVVAGGAVIGAARKVREKVVQVAAERLEADPGDVTISEGKVSVVGTPSRSLTLAEVAQLAYSGAGSLSRDVEMGLEAMVRFRPESFPTWSNATHACIVEIDPTTFVPRISRYVVVEDCGPMINPAVVEGQTYGGVVQGIGGTILEDFRYDQEGNPLTTTFMDYLLPTAADVPKIEVFHLGTPSTTNPGAFKGMGEGGAVGAPAAVANAIADALAHLGVVVTKTALGPGEIYEMVRSI